MLYDVVGKLSDLASRPEFEGEVRKANEEYFAMTGQIFEEDRDFETRMSLFLEWYLYDRLLSTLGVSPLEHFIYKENSGFNEKELEVLKGLLAQEHSVYEFIKAKDKLVTVMDLADEKKFKVFERRGTAGFLRGDVFEARLLPFQNNLYFSGPMLFHPAKSKKHIRAMFGKNPCGKKELVHRLSAMNLKLERYRHVPLEKIYSLEG